MRNETFSSLRNYPSSMDTLLELLRVKIKAVADAYDIPYDGDEGEHTKAICMTGIDLDDFVMEYGHELADALQKKCHD